MRQWFSVVWLSALALDHWFLFSLGPETILTKEYTLWCFFNVIPSFWRNGLDEFIKIYWNSDLHYLSIKVSMFLSKPGMFSLPKLLPIPMYSWRKTYYFVKALWEQSTDICSIKEPEKGWGGQNAYVFKVHNLVKEDLTDNNEDNLEATMTCSWGKVIRRKCDRCDLQKVAGI